MPENTVWQDRHALHLLFLGYRGALRFECPFTIVNLFYIGWLIDLVDKLMIFFH